MVILLLLGLCVAASFGTAPAVRQDAAERLAAPTPKTTDLSLFRSITAQVRAGRNYYVAAIAAQRERNYPVRPFFTIRLPTLTWLIAALSAPGAQVLIVLLAVATVKAWAVRLSQIIRPTLLPMSSGILLMAFSLAPPIFEPGMWFSEIWAGLLIALSLALRSPGHWWASVAAALAAVLIRELALPYLLAMGLLAALAGQRREALGWGLAIGVFALVFLAHADAVHTLTNAQDPVSQGWTGQGGWPLFVAACWHMTILTVLPATLVAVLLPLAFFGLAAWQTPVTLRTFVTLAGYTLLIALFARRDNIYWVWLVSPLLGLGLLFVPIALADLIKSAVAGAGYRPG